MEPGSTHGRFLIDQAASAGDGAHSGNPPLYTIGSPRETDSVATHEAVALQGGIEDDTFHGGASSTTNSIFSSFTSIS